MDGERVCVVGVGAFVPTRTIDTDRIARAIPGWPAERIVEKTGIRERRFLWDFDEKTGRAIPPPPDANFYPANNTDMCEAALWRALAMSKLPATDLDAIFVVTCTPDELNFSHDAMELHRRLGCREDAFAFVVDDGCGGTPYLIDMARKMIEGGKFRSIAVVASAFTSSLIDRDVYTSELELEGGKKINAFLSMYVFGDGAGAVILRAAEGPGDDGILRSVAGTAHSDLVIRRGGGNTRLPYHASCRPVDHAFVVDGLKVAQSYPTYMKRCMTAALEGHEALAPQIKRYYFHQPNKRVMDHFVARSGLPPEKVACHVDTRGNTSAAGMLILLAEDVERGVVKMGSGDLVMIAAVGANVHYGGQLIRL
jgi:3-oxoacyl-[acyl-carrier-protein] synthase-3